MISFSEPANVYGRVNSLSIMLPSLGKQYAG
jgi:hypothetical protein